MKLWTFCALSAAVWLSGCGPSTSQLRNDGISAFQTGRMDEAAKLLQQVLDEKPSDAESLYYMGRIRQAEGAYEQAEFYYRCAIDADPRQREAPVWLEKVRRQLGREAPVGPGRPAR